MSSVTTTTSAPTVTVDDDLHAAKVALQTLAGAAKQRGAVEGSRRLQMVSEHLGELSPDSTYNWINPEALHREIQEAQPHQWLVFSLAIIRNILTLAPLALTWFALSQASAAFEVVASNPDLAKLDQGKSFLQLWQEGFHSHDWLTFSTTAIFDFFFILSIVVLTILIQAMERAAEQRLVKFMLVVQESTEQAVQQAGLARLRPGASVEEIAGTMQHVIDRALKLSQLVAEEARSKMERFATDASAKMTTFAGDATTRLEASNQQITQIYSSQISPLIKQFGEDQKKLQAELAAYQSRINDLTSASAQLGSAAGTLASNAGAYTTVATGIRDQLKTLDATQQTLSGQMGSVATSIGKAAVSVEKVATEITTDMKRDINDMTGNIKEAAETLREVQQQLNLTTNALRSAAAALASIDFNGIGGGGFGVVGVLLRRGSNRRRRGGRTP